MKNNTRCGVDGNAPGAYFPFAFDLLSLDFLVAALGVLFVSSDWVVGGVAGADVGGVPTGAAGGVEPSAAGVVAGGSGFLNGSSQVCRT